MFVTRMITTHTRSSISVAALVATMACARDPSHHVVRVTGEVSDGYGFGELESRTVYLVPRRAWLDSAAVICSETQVSRERFGEFRE